MASTAHPPADPPLVTIELPVLDMDCGSCAETVRHAIASVPGVVGIEVLLAGEKAVVTLDPSRPNVQAIRDAVRAAGYRCPLPTTPAGSGELDTETSSASSLSRTALSLMGVIFGVVLIAVVVGEGLGLFDVLTERVPLWAGALLVIAFGFPIFRTVLRNALRGRVIAHTLMSTGALAALAVGEWATAALVVVFMRVGDYAERATTERARRALKDLTALAPKVARLEQHGVEAEVPIEQVRVGDLVVIRPGEAIPVDGEVESGRATVDQATITGESMPVEVEPGTRVYAATHAALGSLRVRARAVGRDTTFGQIVRQVEQAEANKGETQRLADRFSAWYLPVVAGIALATFLIGGDLLAAVAVTVVACSCAFALATPVAMLASIGAAAGRGLLIKGGKYIEALASADVLLLDKTGTVTLGEPTVTDVAPVGGWTEDDLLALAATAERDSEHPLGAAVRQAAHRRGLLPGRPERFEALPGRGVRAHVHGRIVEVGSRRLLQEGEAPPAAAALEAQGKALLFVRVDGVIAGVLGAADALRPEVADALRAVREAGVCHIELLTGDHERSARSVAEALGVAYRAELLPEDKIAIVRAYQADGHTVMMIGDGVNDAPALVQADVGVAMGAAGSDVAIEAAHVALMRDDWRAVPELFGIARRTMGVVRLNLGFTAVYNLVGITLAALGFLPPILAAALQSLPDLGIMGNSARLLRAGPPLARAATMDAPAEGLPHPS